MTEVKFPSRAMKLLSVLLSTHQPLTLKDIRHSVEGYVSPQDSEEAVKKRLQRDRQLLEKAGIVIETEGGYKIETDRSFTRHLPLRDEERLALLFLEPQISDDPALAGAFSKLNALVDWPEHLRSHVRDHYRFSHPHTVDETVRLCGEALAQSRCLEISYHDASGQSTRRIIEPLHMAYTKGSWYCLAWCHLRQDHRSFNCYRMQDTVVLDQLIDEEREASKDYANLFSRLGTPAFLYGQGQEKKVSILFDSDVAFMIQDKGWPGEWEMLTDGSCRGDIVTKDYAQLFSSLQPFFAHLRVEGPEDFKEFCRFQLESLEKNL